MRLKHVFALAPLLLFAVIAGAADTQLKEISVTAQGGATVVALETAGPFTHNEYRPQPSMVLVDLQKVSSTAMKQRQRSLDSPVVKSYRVLEYKSVGGIGVTRVELTVTDAAKLQVKETKSGLQLLFMPDGSAAASQATPAAAVRPVATSAPAPKPAASVLPKPVAATEAASSQPVTIRNIGVVRTSAGMAVEIEGAKTAKTLRLSGPERLVVDVENSLSATKQRTIMVNAADLKSVRISQFKLAPPVTRVVLDLTGPRDFNIANKGNKLVVTLLPPRAEHSASLTLTAPSPKVEAPATLASAASPQVKPIAAAARLSAALAFAPLTQTVSMNSSTAVLHPVGSAFIDQTVVNAVAQKDPPPQKDTETFPSQVRKDEALPVEKTAPAPVPAPQANGKAERHFQRSPGEVSTGGTEHRRAKGEPSGAQKNPDYVFVVPDYKKQTVAPVQQTAAPVQAVAPRADCARPVAAGPASTRAVEAATTVAQDRPPVLIAQAQPQNAPVLTEQVRAQTQPAVTEQVQPEKPAALAAPVQPEKPPAPTPAANLALEQQKASATPVPPPAVKKYTGEPISVNLKDVDLKDFFRLIHEISGLNIVLDPSVRGTLTLVLDDVPWDQALDVVLHNNGLGRELEGNILRIAAQDTFRKEAEAQRARIEAQALAVSKITVTRFLSYGRAKDVMPTIKKLLTTRGEVLADDRTNALIISDIPSIIPSIDRLITQLDRKTMQVEIEARVVSATRNFAQQFGTQLGFRLGQWVNINWRQPDDGIKFANLYLVFGVVPLLHQRRQHPAVLEPGAKWEYQRIRLFDRGGQLPRGRSAFCRRIARSGEGVVPAASGDAEQCHGGGAPRLPDSDCHAESARRTGDYDLHRCLSAADRYAADHGGKHDLPRGRRGEHDPGFRQFEHHGGRQSQLADAAGDNAGSGE